MDWIHWLQLLTALIAGVGLGYELATRRLERTTARLNDALEQLDG